MRKGNTLYLPYHLNILIIILLYNINIHCICVYKYTFQYWFYNNIGLCNIRLKSQMYVCKV
uniref:Uncharacterized protein n=1 Tax=Anguilla anguilla TaxID=7936 RepID=A0A0E9V7L6_ANGAN